MSIHVPRRRRAVVRVAAALAIGAAALTTTFITPASAALGFSDLNGSTTATDLANTLAGPGVTVSNVTYVGDLGAAGTYSGGTGIVGPASGLVLSSGYINSAMGPNDSTGAGQAIGTPGDTDLDTLSGQETFDAAVLEFDFVPTASPITFSYVFGSDEYLEYVNQGVNDSFGFFVNGANCATVGAANDPVTIDTVNDTTNSSLFINNEDAHLDTQMDGLTVVLTCTASVTPNATNHMKLAIADGGDYVYNSWVFLAADSLTVPPENCGNGIDDDGDGLIDAADPDCGSPPDNTPPTVDAGANASGTEGSAIALAGTVNDPDAGDTVTQQWSYTTGAGVDVGATCSFSAPNSVNTNITCTDDGSYTATLTANDGVNPPVADSATVTVGNANPTANITTPAENAMYQVGGPVNLSAALGDAGANDTHTCQIDWGDGIVEAGIVGSGTCTGSHSYAAIGTPLITVTVTDDDGGTGSDTVSIVVADSSTKVTGGGFVIQDGRTSFGFVSKTGADGPQGQIQVRFDKSRFHGTTVSSLTISGKTATWSGTGRLDKQDGYTFEVSVVDNRNGGGKKGTADTITLTIRDGGGNVVHSVSGPLKGGNLTVH